MEDGRNSENENEELRKQIQFLTDIIKNAKSGREHSYKKQPAALSYQTQATYSNPLRHSKPHKSLFHRGVSHSGLTDSATFNRQGAYAHNADSYHWGSLHSDLEFRQNSSHYDTKHSQPVSQLSSKVTDNKKIVSKQDLMANKSRSENVKGATDIKAVGTRDKANVKSSVPSHVIHSSMAAQLSSTNSSKCSKRSLTGVSERDANLKHQNQIQVKSQAALGVTRANLTELKSTLTSGNSNQLPSKSDPKLLQKEIEKMHNKITELKKMISERKSTSDPTGNLDSAVNSPLRKAASESHASMSNQGKFTQQTSKSLIIKSDNLSQGDFKRALSMSPGKASAEKYTAMGYQKSRVTVSSRDGAKCNVMAKNIGNDYNTQPQSDLVSVSKYKLTRIGSSPTKQSSTVAGTSGGKAVSSVTSNLDTIHFNVEPVKSTNKKQSLISDSTSGTGLNTRTPAKFVKKSKYAISRLRSSGKKGPSKNKHIRRYSNTPAKFVSFSKYAIKRVRRSLSDESKQASKDATGSVKGAGRYKTIVPSPVSIQNGITVVKSKFKMEKIPLPKLIAKNRYKLSQSAQYYKFDRSKFYRQRNYHLYKQGYKDRHNWNARFGFHGGIKRGRYSSMYTGQGRTYRGYMGRYQRAFQHPRYNRRLAVSPRYVQRKIQLLKEKVPFNPKLRLDRRTVVTDAKRAASFVMINGMLYKSNAKKLEKAVTAETPLTTSKEHRTTIKKSATSNMKTVTVRGVKFEVDCHGRSLKRVPQLCNTEGKGADVSSLKTGRVSRIDIGGVTYMQTKPGTLERVGSVKSRMAAARVVNKTVQRAAAKYRKDNTKVKKKKKYCMFYNRFGKCNKKGNCPYIHDPEKVAVCTRFLRGTCKVKDCPFSHKVSRDKMPMCSYFLKGVCNRDDCPYLHVNVNKDAEICEDFLKGYCPQAEKCTKKHILKCPEFSKTGVCSKGEKCKLQHRRAKKRTIQSSEESISENSKKPKLLEEATAGVSSVTPVGEKFSDSTGRTENSPETDKQGKMLENNTILPFKERKLPAYISLKTSVDDMKKDIIVISEDMEKPTEKPAMRIRPQL